MTLWHRAPREVYRVYGQDEYLAEDDLQVEAPSAPPSGEEAHGSRSGRLVGLGVLVGVTVGALGLVALNATHRSPAAPRVVVAQTTHPGAAAHASVDAPISHRSVVGMSNGPAARRRAPARARTRAPGHPSAGSAHPSAGSAGGNTTVAPTSAESVSKAASAESAQPPQSTTSEPMGSGAQAPPIGGEFEFER
jgi:hypothetical protein